MCDVCWSNLLHHILLIELWVDLQHHRLSICINILDAVAPISTE